MITIPEVLDHIASFLDADSCFACISVCRQWKEVFTPHLWRSIDPDASPHCRIFSCRGNKVERQRWIANLLRTYKKYIRDLTVTDAAVLLWALDNDVRDLRSLTMEYSTSIFWCLEGLTGLDDNDRGSKRVAESAIQSHSCDTVIPRSAFGDDEDDEKIQLTRATWLLVSRNSGLRCLAFDFAWCVDWIETHLSDDPEYEALPILHPRSIGCLPEILSRLPWLRHIEIGIGADDYLLTQLATVIPNLESFIHSDLVKFDPQAIALQPPHRALKRLVFCSAISSKQLRAIVLAFPEMQHLEVRNVETENKGNISNDGNDELEEAAGAEVLECSLLTALVVNDEAINFPGIFNSLVRFPRITGLSWYVGITGLDMIRQVLWIFPALQRVDTVDLDSREITFGGEMIEGDNVYLIQELFICNRLYQANKDMAFFTMPFLVVLEMHGCTLDGSSLAQINKTCRALQQLWFDLDTGCSREMLDLLADGPAMLRSCRGGEHIVLAKDLIRSAEWSCTGLKELDITIAGVVRMTKNQERLVNNMRKLDPDWFKMMALNTTDPEVEEERKQVCKRMRKLGHQLRYDEVKALEQRQNSNWMQRKIYQRLGRLTQLNELSLGKVMEKCTWRTYSVKVPETNDTPEFNLESGLAELASLAHLKELNFFGMSHRIGEQDLEWMHNQWSVTEKEQGCTAYSSHHLYLKKSA
ncbi:hypothetical protein BGW39_011555 [Mortierella sp. 14UC]|nr:hypothetical protein BGW39_011555 [Mortierella sp. 14UC]